MNATYNVALTQLDTVLNPIITDLINSDTFKGVTTVNVTNRGKSIGSLNIFLNGNGGRVHEFITVDAIHYNGSWMHPENSEVKVY